MEARLVEFVRLLRSSGVRASAAELTEAARAAALVGVGERSAFRAALRSTLVKRALDVPVFDQLFDLYFSALGRALEEVDEALLDEIERSRLLEGDDLDAAREALSAALHRLSPLARAALSGDQGTLARLFQSAALQLDFSGLVMAAQVSFYARRLLSGAGGSTLAHDRADLDQALRTAGLTPRGLALVTARVGEALDRIEEAARRWVELKARARSIGRRRAGLPLSATPISQADRQRVETAVRRLAERLKARLQRRERSRRRGALHVRRTLRRNMGLGGLPATLVFKRKQRERPDVVVLCDVSDSVRNVSRLMLLFLYTLQEIFQRVRSFVFVSEVGEVTDVFRQERDAALVLRVQELRPGHLVRGLLDLVAGRRLRDAEHVVGAAGHGYSATTTRAGRRTTSPSLYPRCTTCTIEPGSHPSLAWVSSASWTCGSNGPSAAISSSPSEARAAARADRVISTPATTWASSWCSAASRARSRSSSTGRSFATSRSAALAANACWSRSARLR